MYKTIAKSLQTWHDTTSDRVKLQHAYVASAIGLLLLAGLVGLVNYDQGQRIVTVALLCLGAFLVNMVAWALLSGLVLLRLNKPDQTTTTKTKPTSRKKR